MVNVNSFVLVFAVAVDFANSEPAVLLKMASGSPQSAAVSSGARAKRPAGWEEFEKAVRSVNKTERGTFSMAQVRHAIQSLSERMGAVMGQGPKGVHRYITENLLPQAQQTKQEMQAEVDAAAAKVENCGRFLWSAEKEVEHREKILLEDESGKYQCIAREHQLHKTEKDKCDEKLTFQQTLEPPVSINNVSKTPQAMKEALTKNYEFYNTAYPEFVNRKGACDDATAAAQAQLAECDADEVVIEEFYCKMKQGRDDACGDYEKCYDDEKVDLAAEIEKVKKLEAKVKEHFQMMTCFQGSFGEENTDVEECDPNQYETNGLDVNYPQTPAKAMCVSIMNTRRDYSEIVCNNGEVVSGEASRTSDSGGGNSTSDGGNSSM